MACPAAVRHTHAAIASDPSGMAPDTVWEKVRWWTPATINEAIDDLVEAGMLRRESGRVFCAEGER